MHHQRHLSKSALTNLVREALAEDIGSGDATTLAVVPAEQTVTARFRPREDCIVAGLPLMQLIFEELDREVVVDIEIRDGRQCASGETIASVAGPAQAILTGERTALNFMQRLSGIATVSRQYVDALGDTRTQLLDTRKTTPGLRLLEKYAVSCGDGVNHRFGLYDRVMIKDNHLQLAAIEGPGGIARAVKSCRQQYPFLEVEVEADTMAQVEEALNAKADYILLDNMSDEELVEAVKLRDTLGIPSLLEASGGMTLERMPSVGKTGVDFVSVGALTHSAPSIDIGLDINLDSPEYPFGGQV